MLSTIIDFIVIITLATAFIRGVRKGFLGHIIGILSLIIGIWGGNFIAGKYSEEFSQSYYMPWISQKVEQAIAATPFSSESIENLSSSAQDELRSLLTEVLSNVAVPDFVKNNVNIDSIIAMLSDSADYVVDTGNSLQQATASIISNRLAYLTLFIISFLVIQTVAFYVFAMVNAIFKLPIIGAVNRLAGGLLGLLFSSIMLCCIFWAVGTIIPQSKAEGGVLSPDVLESTYVAKYIGTAENALFSFINY